MAAVLERGLGNCRLFIAVSIRWYCYARIVRYVLFPPCVYATLHNGSAGSPPPLCLVQRKPFLHHVLCIESVRAELPVVDVFTLAIRKYNYSLNGGQTFTTLCRSVLHRLQVITTISHAIHCHDSNVYVSRASEGFTAITRACIGLR